MRIPAFGEWNHHGADGDGIGSGNGTWPAVMTPFFDLATPQKAAPKTVRVPITTTTLFLSSTALVLILRCVGLLLIDRMVMLVVQGRRRRGGDGFNAAKLPTAAEAPQGHVQTRRSKVADSGAYAAAARRSCFTVAKPVDDDLYGVPPDTMLYGKPPGARVRTLLPMIHLFAVSPFCIDGKDAW
jgi:hypothetical protein